MREEGDRMIVQINYDDTHPILTGEDGVPVEDRKGREDPPGEGPPQA